MSGSNVPEMTPEEQAYETWRGTLSALAWTGVEAMAHDAFMAGRASREPEIEAARREQVEKDALALINNGSPSVWMAKKLASMLIAIYEETHHE